MPSPALPAALAELVAYFEPLSTRRRDCGGAVTLATPGVNVFALNATFLPDASTQRLPSILDWHRAQGLPPLVAATVPLPGNEVAAVRVGTYHPLPDVGVIRVEQVSRLMLPTWAAVLAEAYGTPEWALPLARHLGPRLEGDRDAVLLLAYAGDEAVGALLWRASPGEGGGAHLWGTLDPAVDAPLLNAARELAGSLNVSLPDSSPLSVTGETIVRFHLVETVPGQQGLS